MATNLISTSPIGTAQAARKGLLARLGGALLRLEQQSRIYFELSQMNRRELADLGLSQSDIPAVVRGKFRRA